MMVPHTHALEIRNLSKSFGHIKAVRNASFDVPEGSIFGLIGRNGAGKTTIMRMMMNIYLPDSGEILLRGKQVDQEFRNSVGYLPEERGLYKKMKVGEQALYLSRLKGLSRHDAMNRLRDWFERFGMTQWWNKKIEELSKGMAQKVQFIVTVLHEPELLIFDEPFSGFDPVNATMLKKEVFELSRKGTTVIFSTHDMASVEELCDHITLIDRSRTILEGSVHDIKQQFKENLYELIYEGNSEELNKSLNGNFTLKHEEKLADGTQRALIRLADTKKGNDLLSLAIKKLTVLSFREVLPGMNSIFIQAVSQNKNPRNHE